MDKNSFCEYLSGVALKAILYEVAASPKPGLVDRYNSGAHRDMDIFTFLSSATVLGPVFYNCAQAGANFKGEDKRELLNILRPLGMQGEQKMFEATKGVNTHKGLIFSLGIISAAAGSLYRQNSAIAQKSADVCRIVQEMAAGLTERELQKSKKSAELTHGERNYYRYKVQGIRGEVEAGFATVRNYGLPIMTELWEKAVSEDNNDSSIQTGINERLNKILIQVLLHLMKNTIDSNVIARHNLETLESVKTLAGEVLQRGGMYTPEGKVRIEELNEEFSARRISPGGAADLLAVTIMLFLLENPKII